MVEIDQEAQGRRIDDRFVFPGRRRAAGAPGSWPPALLEAVIGALRKGASDG
jgi:hypothetical protein